MPEIETVKVVAQPYGYKVINKSDMTESDVLYVEPADDQKQEQASTEKPQQKKRGAK